MLNWISISSQAPRGRGCSERCRQMSMSSATGLSPVISKRCRGCWVSATFVRRLRVMFYFVESCWSLVLRKRITRRSTIFSYMFASTKFCSIFLHQLLYMFLGGFFGHPRWPPVDRAAATLRAFGAPRNETQTLSTTGSGWNWIGLREKLKQAFVRF